MDASIAPTTIARAVLGSPQFEIVATDFGLCSEDAMRVAELLGQIFVDSQSGPELAEDFAAWLARQNPALILLLVRIAADSIENPHSAYGLALQSVGLLSTLTSRI